MAWNITPDTAIPEVAMFHGFVVERQAAQLVATATPALIDFDTEILDTDGYLHSLPMDQFNFWTGQFYLRAVCQVQFEAHSTGARSVHINVGSGAYGVILPTAAAPASVRVQAMTPWIREIDPDSDLVSVEVVHTAGVDLNILNAWLSVEIVRTPVGRPLQ